MKLLLTLIIVIHYTVFFAGCAQKEMDVIGTWRLDANATVQKAIDLGQIPEEEKQKMIEQLASREERYLITVTQEKIKSEKFDTTYTLLAASAHEVQLHFELNEESIILTFSPYDTNYAVIKSSTTNDMDYLLWQKTLL
jgi:hypothetical protein